MKVNREVNGAIKTAKLKYKDRGNLHSAWQGLKNMAAVNIVSTSCKPIQVAGSTAASLPNVKLTPSTPDLCPQREVIIYSLKLCDSVSIIYNVDVVRALKMAQVNTAPGPDNICCLTLRYGTEQLGEVFQLLFQRPVFHGIVLRMWKQSLLIPVPKKGTVKVLNDLRPVAFTKEATDSPDKMDALQFAYCAGRSVAMMTQKRSLWIPSISIWNFLFVV